jgi:outer membrane usher protein
VAFNRSGSLVASAALRGNAARRDVVRGDTYWRKDLPGRMETVVIGDSIGATAAWSRPVRFGGIRYARDFALAPGYVTYPMPSITGSAALSSTVDVLINNRRNATQRVRPGPFEITDVPIVTGAGEMQVVVRDLLGRETVISQSYYVAPQLLAPGLSDFSFEAGALRENYGTRSNDYGAAFGAGTYRLGLTDAFTGEVRGEAQRDRVAAGGSMATVVGELGVVELGTGYAISDGESGGHYIATLQRVGPSGGASVAWGHFDRGYRQFGANAFEIRPKDQWVASAGMAFGYGMTAGINYTRQTTWSGDRFELVGANIGIPVDDNVYLSFYVSKDLAADDGWSGALSLIVPFDERGTIAASSTRDADGHVVNTLQATRSVPAGPGFGWRVAASDSRTQRVQAGAAFNGHYGQLTADANAGDGTNALRLGANGSLGWLQGLSFASPRIDHGAFAVVHVGDLEDVPVSVSNQITANTDRHGLALVTGLLPYQVNQLTISPDELPLGVEIGGVRESVVPYARSGVFVDFPVRRSRNVLVILQQSDGTVVPAGARVTVLPGGQQFIVAKRGEVYLTDARDENRLDVRWNGGACTLSLTVPAAAGGKELPRLGPLTCKGSQ